jgi:hypothetical protein
LLHQKKMQNVTKKTICKAMTGKDTAATRKAAAKA